MQAFLSELILDHSYKSSTEKSDTSQVGFACSNRKHIIKTYRKVFQILNLAKPKCNPLLAGGGVMDEQSDIHKRGGRKFSSNYNSLLLFPIFVIRIEFMKYLQKGDKVRVKATGEGAEILKVLSSTEAIIDTFDGDLTIHCEEVLAFTPADAGLEVGAVKFMESEEKPKKAKEKDAIPFAQERRNRFSYSLDLHAQKLIGNTDSKSNEEILSIQLSRLKTYLEEAAEYKIQRVYIIHGIGTGRLKSEVHSLLQAHPRVFSFSNDYHPQHGMGATEARLR